MKRVDLRRLSVAMAIMGAAIAWSGSTAQTVDDDQPSSAASLGLPSELTVFGKTDPAIHKATAIVNGSIITDTDVDQRLALVTAANGDAKIAADELDRVRLQVLRNLIDETLQIQEAKANDVTVTPAEIDQSFGRVARNFKKSAADFTTYLKSIGSSAVSMKRQIEGETAWQRLLGRRIEPTTNVSDEEVRSVIARLNAAKGSFEYHVAEIYLSATPQTTADVLANANRIVGQVRGGASFVAYARQFSESSTAAVGGDLGWVRAEQLPDAMAQTVQAMQAGQISDPIAVAGGYSVVALVDKRQVLTADPRDAVLALRQLSISFPAGSTQDGASPKVAAFAEALKALKGCGDVDALAKAVGADVVDSDAVKVRDLPPRLQEIMLGLSIGQASPPFGSLDQGVRSLVLCGRDDPAASRGPDFDTIQQQLQDERVNRRAQRYLRDLRRDAVIEYR